MRFERENYSNCHRETEINRWLVSLSRQQLLKLFGAPPSPACLVACQSCDTAPGECPGPFVSWWSNLKPSHLPAAAWLWTACGGYEVHRMLCDLDKSHNYHTTSCCELDCSRLWDEMVYSFALPVELPLNSMSRHSHCRSYGNESLLYQLLSAAHLYYSHSLQSEELELT